MVEHGGQRILFDTGNNSRVFESNVKAAGMDLKQLDFVVISHRHLDHPVGLAYLLSVNPTVKVYVPKESFEVFCSALPSTFYRKQDSLPQATRYYDGHSSDTLAFGTAGSRGKTSAPGRAPPGRAAAWVRFELTKDFRPWRFSRPLPSTARPPRPVV